MQGWPGIVLASNRCILSVVREKPRIPRARGRLLGTRGRKMVGGNYAGVYDGNLMAEIL